MSMHVFDEADLIEVKTTVFCIYGPPGVWKTSLAQTAEAPFTLDFDLGIHRAANRKRAGRFDSWHDTEALLQGKVIADRKTLVVDTLGRCLDLLSGQIVSENAKWGSRTGGLTLQGFGVLKSRFAFWIGAVRASGRDLVLLAHEKEEKDGDYRVLRPDIQGGSYSEVMKFADLIGYMNADSHGRRFLTFAPTEKTLGKNPCGWGRVEVPRLTDHPNYLAGLIAEAKEKMGATAAASALVAATVQQWQAFFNADPDLAAFNDNLQKLREMSGTAKAQAWELSRRHAESKGWIFNRESKVFEEVADDEA